MISKVHAIALDTMIPGLRLDRLKTDVQGFDLEVLQGTEKLLDANRALLVLIEFLASWLRTRRKYTGRIARPSESIRFRHLSTRQEGLLHAF